MSIESEAERIVAQFPANFPAGNWQEIGRLYSGGGRSTDIATPNGVLESAEMPTGVNPKHLLRLIELALLERIA